jgi:hypothetical protein
VLYVTILVHLVKGKEHIVTKSFKCEYLNYQTPKLRQIAVNHKENTTLLTPKTRSTNIDSTKSAQVAQIQGQMNAVKAA